MRIALAQVTSGRDLEANLQLIADRTAQAAEQGAELVIFPEAMMRSFGHRLAEIAEPLDGPWAVRLTEIADRHDVWLIAGMFTPGDQRKVANSLLLTGRGRHVGYTKIHLYDAFGFRESDTVAAGTEPVVVDLDGLGVGLTTCYDVRFPGLFARLADDGADLIVVAASWGAGPDKLDHWRLLTRARALDATTFVAACGQSEPSLAGVEARPGAPTGIGYSAVIGPDGRVLDELGAGPGLLVVDVDRAEVAKLRDQLPVLVNRRF